MLLDKRQRFGVPQLSECSVVSLADEQNSKADDKEAHKAAFHDVFLSKDYWVKGLVRFWDLHMVWTSLGGSF